MGIQERKRREREQRRQQIMNAARKVFSINGFMKTTMEDIAREAELSPGTLYLYFKNKDELYASLSVVVLEHLYEKLKRVFIKEAQNPQMRIDDLKQTLYDIYEVDPLILLNLFHLQSSEILKNLAPPTDVMWALFSGVVLWEESKRIISNKRETNALAFDMAFEIFSRGISQ